MSREAFFPQGSGEVFYRQITTFGNGQIGQAIKAQIERGVACEEILPDGIGRVCPNIAVIGIHWQAGEHLIDTVFTCNGEGTVSATLSELVVDLRKNGFTPNISINGHGRP